MFATSTPGRSRVSRSSATTIPTGGRIASSTTSIERLAKEEGREEGLEQGKLAVLKRLLTRRFGALPGQILALLEKASPVELERWIDRVLDAESLDEVFAGS